MVKVIHNVCKEYVGILTNHNDGNKMMSTQSCTRLQADLKSSKQVCREKIKARSENLYSIEVTISDPIESSKRITPFPISPVKFLVSTFC